MVLYINFRAPSVTIQIACDGGQFESRSKEIPRASLLEDKEKTNIGRIPFSTTYNEMSSPVRKIINSHWSVLHTKSDLAETFKDRPVIAFRRNKNLRNILGQVHLLRGRKLVKNQRKPRHPGSKACLMTSLNQCCRHLRSTKMFKSDNIGGNARDQTRP